MYVYVLLAMASERRSCLSGTVLGLGPSSPGRIPHSKLKIDRADAEASGFEQGLETEGENKEGFLSKGIPH